MVCKTPFGLTRLANRPYLTSFGSKFKNNLNHSERVSLPSLWEHINDGNFCSFARRIHFYRNLNCQVFMENSQEKDKLVSEVIRYVLFRTHQGNGCPVKREELTKLITKSYQHRSLPAFIINQAREKFSNIFGYEMKELQRSRPSTNRQSRASQQSFAESKSYILESKLSSDIYKKYVEDKSVSHISGFAFVVISIIHLAGGKIPEETLWHHLRRMEFSESDENHPVFGNTKQALDLLVQQRFLQKEKVNGAEGNAFIYELAERTLEGSVYEKLKEHIVEIVNKDSAAAAVEDD